MVDVKCLHLTYLTPGAARRFHFLYPTWGDTMKDDEFCPGTVAAYYKVQSAVFRLFVIYCEINGTVQELVAPYNRFMNFEPSAKFAAMTSPLLHGANK